MPIQAPQWTDFRLCPVCQNEYNQTQKPPISLGCGHSICQSCLFQLSKQQCPFDQAEIQIAIKKLPINYALLSLVGGKINDCVDSIEIEEVQQNKKEYSAAKKAIEILAQSLQNVVISGTSSNNNSYSTGSGALTRPMQRKLVTLIHTQLAEDEGRSRALRAARSIGERAVKELILMHQNPQTLSTTLWAAVRQRGCQFLGPAMQEAVLHLIVLSLEDGISLSRKVLVLFVVQRLEKQFTQASKTSIGHVVQLLYRASCFKVTKRKGDSSLLQLQEKYRTYSALRKEHDAQIVQIAMEAGLHISPEQWSALLYGDDEHKSHMQSIIDKLQTPASFASSIQELVIALQRTNDPHNLQSLRQHLDKLSAIDPSPDAVLDSWEQLEECMESLSVAVTGLQSYSKEYASRNKGNLEGAQMFNTKYRTSMCRDILQKINCPRGSNCNFAHTEEELEKYRKRRFLSYNRPPPQMGNMPNGGAPPMMNGMAPNGMPPYPNSRASSSPDSCINADLDDEIVEMTKITQVRNEPFPPPQQQHNPTMHRVPMGYMDQEGSPQQQQMDINNQMKNLSMNGHPPPNGPYTQPYANNQPNFSQPQVSPPQQPKKNEQVMKLPPGYAASMPPQMPPQNIQPNAPPPRQPPSMYSPPIQQQAHYQPSYYDMREPPMPQQPPPHAQVYLQSNQHPYVTNAQVYQPPPQQAPQFNGGYMQYQQPNMDYPTFNGHFPHPMPIQRTAVGARGASNEDFKDLIKPTKSEFGNLSISVKDDSDWKTGGGSSSTKSSAFDYIDSGRGSSSGYHSSSDAFSPISNSSLGSRSSPPNMKPDSDCSKMFDNIWSLEPKSSGNGWTTGKTNGWDNLLDTGNRMSDADDRNTSNESLGRSSEHQSTTLDDERSYTSFMNLSRSSSDLLNNNTSSTANQNGSTSSANHDFMGLLSPTLTRRPPPGFGLILNVKNPQ
uniref:RING-type E3 ubiquitin transferase n=1 Tax=Clytia hemisphaerica TaxID=252671 RepID=A0A7M5V5F6_9CNID